MFRPVYTILKVEMKQQLNKIKMKRGSDLLILFEKFSGIHEKLLTPGNKIDEIELIVTQTRISKKYCLSIAQYQGINSVLNMLMNVDSYSVEMPPRVFSSKRQKNDPETTIKIVTYIMNL
jgi:hypothetical protein